MAASILSSAFSSVPDSMLGSILDNILGCVPGNGLEVYLEASLELTWEHRV